MSRRPPKSPLFPSPPLFRSTTYFASRCRTKNEILPPQYETCRARTALRGAGGILFGRIPGVAVHCPGAFCTGEQDRKSTRLNSSHDQISYAVFCLKKKKKQE